MDRCYGDRPASDTSLRWSAAAAFERVRDARRDPARVLLEGIHALKHAVRFGADLEVVVTPDRARLTALLGELAPDVTLEHGRTVELAPDRWGALVPRELPSPALAVAHRPVTSLPALLAAPGRLVALDSPRHLGNLGAAIRVAAAADAGGVLVVGESDPWHPTAIRAAAGLQFALPVARTDTLPHVGRPLVALDPGGDELAPGALAADAMLLVGTERGGLSPALLARADLRLRLPMRAGVSSLNLATAVAAALYR